MKILTPPPGLLEFLERVGSNAKVYEITSSAEQLSLSLGCREEEILTTTLILHADRAPRLSVHSRNQTPELLSGERAANPTQVYLLTGYSAEWMPPFGLPHLLETAIDSRCLESPCLYIPQVSSTVGWLSPLRNLQASLILSSGAVCLQLKRRCQNTHRNETQGKMSQCLLGLLKPQTRILCKANVTQR